MMESGTKINHVLISWLGDSDIKNLPNYRNDEKNAGPLYSILKNRAFGEFRELVLFMTPSGIPAGMAENAREEAVRLIGALCRKAGIRLSVLKTPEKFAVADPVSIYQFMSRELERKFGKSREPLRFYYNLTSGTPAMYAIQLHISASSNFAGKALYTIHRAMLGEGENNVFIAPIPASLSQLESGPEQKVELFQEANQKVYDQVRLKVANSRASVLIQGETGTGKSALAAYIHAQDRNRSKNRMIVVNCAALGADASSIISELFGHARGSYTGAETARKGAFLEADQSTLFLDEIAEIPLPFQGMLLRALDTGRIKQFGSEKEEKADVRLIAATNTDLARAIREGRFRSDLYFRLAQYSPQLKPVRHYSPLQKEKLLDYILEDINSRLYPDNKRRLSPEARELLLNHPWYGNIREMKFRLESICLLSEALIKPDDVSEQLEANNIEKFIFSDQSGGENGNLSRILPSKDKNEENSIPKDLKAWLNDWEEHWLRLTSHYYPNSVEAAERLGLKKSTFFNKKEKYNIK